MVRYAVMAEGGTGTAPVCAPINQPEGSGLKTQHGVFDQTKKPDQRVRSKEKEKDSDSSKQRMKTSPLQAFLGSASLQPFCML